jgi:hypothetical protein
MENVCKFRKVRRSMNMKTLVAGGIPKIKSSRLCLSAAAWLFLAIGLIAPPPAACGQAEQQSSPDAALPFAAQLRKVVVLIETDCLHEPTPEELAKLTPEERAMWTPEGIARLTDQQMATMKQDKWLGTGFIVRILDSGLVAKLGKDSGYNYLVTNRHVIQPGIEHGHPCKVVRRYIGANLKDKSSTGGEHLQMVPQVINDGWEFPTDEAVDLAATNFLGQADDWDFQVFNDSMFVPQEALEKEKVAEGDSVLFAGLFIQYVGGSRLEPIVRSGKIAMLPRDLINTTLGKPGHVILAEVHSFGGNSGSPVFVEVHPDRSSLAFHYEFLGVVAGEVYETSDLTLQATTSYKGNLQANSNISMLIPAEEVRVLLFKPEFVKQRDFYTAAYLKTK